MFRYPAEHSITEAFFKLSIRILKAESIDALLPVIDSESDEYKSSIEGELAVLIDYRDHLQASIEANRNAVTEYQFSFFLCEVSMVMTLEVLYNTKIVQFTGAPEDAEYQQKLAVLSSLWEKNEVIGKHKLTRALCLYMVITAKVIEILDNIALHLDDHQFNAWQALGVLEYIYKFKQELLDENLESCHVKEMPHIDLAFAKKIRSGLLIMLNDQVPQKENNCELLPYQLTEIYVNSLLMGRTIHQAYLKKSTPGSFEAQKLREHMARMDALLQSVNLKKNELIRDKYTSCHLGYKRLNNIPVLLTAVNSKLSMADAETVMNILIDRLVDCEEIFVSVNLYKVTDETRFQYRQTLNQRIENIYFDTSILQSYLRSISTSESGLAKKVLVDIEYLYRACEAILFLVDSPFKHIFACNFFSFTISDIESSGDINDKLANFLVTMLKLRHEFFLRCAMGDAQKRIGIFNTIASELRKMIEGVKKLELSTADDSTILQRKLVVCKQLIADYYLSSLMLCVKVEESNALSCQDLTLDIYAQMANMVNKPIYEFTLAHLLYSQANSYRKVASQDDIAQSSEIPEITEMDFHELCSRQIAVLHAEAPRVHHSVRTYFFEHARYIIEKLKQNGDDGEKARAESSRSKIKNYLALLERSVQAKAAKFSSSTSYMPPNLKPFFVDESGKKNNKPKTAVKQSNSNSNSNSKSKSKSKSTSKSKSQTSKLEERPEIIELLEMDKKKKRAKKDRKLKAKSKAANVSKAPSSLQIPADNDDLSEQLLEPVEEVKPDSLLMPVMEEAPEILIPLSKPDESVELVEPVKVAHQTSPLVSHSMFPLPARSPSPVVSLLKVDAPVFDFFDDIRIDMKLPIKLPVIEALVERSLRLHGLHPKIHGSLVVNKLFKLLFPTIEEIAHNDIDLLCFSSYETLEQIISGIKFEGYDVATRKNKNNVMVVMFKPTSSLETGKSVMPKQKDIEIIYMPPKEGLSRLQQLRELFIEFGINWTLCYDMASQFILDPACQFSRITNDKLIEVSVNAAHTEKCFQTNPGLILYIIEKLNLFERYQVKLGQGLQNAMENTSRAYSKICPARLPVQIPISRLNKLFLLGERADQAFVILEKYHLVPFIFPLLAINYSPLKVACVELDKYKRYEDIGLISEEEWKSRQTTFLSIALFYSFTYYHNIFTYQQDIDRFKCDANAFFNTLNVWIAPAVQAAVHDVWWSNIQHIVQAPVNTAPIMRQLK